MSFQRCSQLPCFRPQYLGTSLCRRHYWESLGRKTVTAREVPNWELMRSKDVKESLEKTGRSSSVSDVR